MLVVSSATNVGWVLYTDDIVVLILPLIIGLQQMLVVCSASAKAFAFKLNGNKSHCLCLRKLANVDIGPMLFDNQSIAWCHSIEYLGVLLLSGKCLFFGIAPIKKGSFMFHVLIVVSFSRCLWNHPVVWLSSRKYCLPIVRIKRFIYIYIYIYILCIYIYIYI